MISKSYTHFVGEAFNVHNKTGLMPRELMEQRDKLATACEKARELFAAGKTVVEIMVVIDQALPGDE